MPIKGPRGSVFHSSGPKHSRHKPTKKYLEAYWPYIPMVVIIIIGLFWGSYKPQHKTTVNGVLAYATDTTSGGLLQNTNAQRASNGESGLTLNSKLNSAAQAKANDMVARDYWSHTTPDGQQPWIFISNAGYSYSKAGENLAYGFATSADTVTGWMNSAPHRANILDSSFTEVGFGIANAPNYVGTGQETVVVAMYARPQVLGATSSTTPAAPGSSNNSNARSGAAASSGAAQPSSSPTPEPTTPTTVDSPPAEKKVARPVTSAGPIQNEPASLAITRGQTVTGGRVPWIVSLAGFIASIAVILLLIRHGVEVKKVFKKGEKFALQHPVFDTAMVSAMMIAYVLSSTSGVIR